MRLFRGWFGHMSCPPAAGMMCSWLPWCHRCHPELPLGHVSSIGLRAGRGQFAWGKASDSTRDKKRGCYAVFFQVQTDVFPPYFSPESAPAFIFIVFPFSQCRIQSCSPTWPVSPLSSDRSCRFDISGFEVWSYSCMASTAASAVHLYAGWRGRSALVLTASQSAKLVHSIRAAKLVNKLAAHRGCVES